jgi:ketosteroid isomerase-like protein
LDREQLEAWIAGYERAWRTPGTEALAELFTPDASYSTAPFERPHVGLEAIAEMWVREREGPDEPFEMQSEVIAVQAEVGVARIEVRYGGPRRQEYRDLWIVRLDGDGRCSAFEEWPFWPPGSSGKVAGGA